MRIQHNIAALNSYRQLNGNNSAVAKNLEKLSSGYKINRAGDDAAGLAISEKMRAQITGLETAQSNAQDGISLIQTAEGNLQEVHSMLNRMVELATQSANGTYDDEVDRANLQKEVASLSSEIDRIAESANFNGIKLLNGDLGKTALNSYSKNNGVENLADGIINNAPVDGAGLQDEFSLDFNGTFGAGDTITYTANFTDAAGNQISKNITLEYDAAAVAASAGGAAAAGKFAGGTKEQQMESIAAALREVTVGGSGTDAANKLFADYTIGVESSTNSAGDTSYKIKLKANDEGISNVQLSTATGSTAVVDKYVTANQTVTTNGANSSTAATAPSAVDFANLLNNAADLEVGDELTISAKVQGRDVTVTLKVGASTAATGNGVFHIGTNIEETTENLVDALKDASFNDNDATGIDESQFKVSDYFDITANKDAAGTAATGSIQIENKSGAGIIADTNAIGATTGSGAAGLSIKRNGTEIKTASVTAATTAGIAAPTDGVKQVSTMTFQNGFMDGDSVTIRGNLSDGLSFEVTLTAGVDFALGATDDATLANLTDALNGATGTDGTSHVQLKVTQSDGSVKDVAADKIFGAGNEFTVATGTAGSGKITITSNTAGLSGAGFASVISSADTTIAEKNQVTNATVTQDVVGKSQSTALNTITFDPSKIEQGTKLTIDGKTYEFVSSADFLTNENNTAVVVQNLNKRDADGNLSADAAKGEDIAKALINALHNDSTTVPGIGGATGAPALVPGAAANAYVGKYTAKDGQVYNLSVDPNSNSLKIETKDNGTLATALKDIEIASGNQNTSVIKFNTETTGAGSAQKTTANVKVGDTITVDGKTYEFTDGEHRTKTEGNVEVKLNVKDGYTAEDAAKALADAINANTKADIDDGKPGGVIASVGTVENKDGSRSFVVNLASKYNDTKGEGHEYDAPVVEIPTSGKGLTLQVGETSEEFQKVNVAIDKMDAASLGIGDISVGKQPDAAAAIDKIKAAINTVSSTRGDLGAIQNRLEHTINNLGVTTENMTAAESRIRDTDMAKEMMEFTKNNILVQASQAMLAQANQLPQGVLQLLQ